MRRVALILFTVYFAAGVFFPEMTGRASPVPAQFIAPERAKIADLRTHYGSVTGDTLEGNADGLPRVRSTFDGNERPGAFLNGAWVARVLELIEKFRGSFAGEGAELTVREGATPGIPRAFRTMDELLRDTQQQFDIARSLATSA